MLDLYCVVFFQEIPQKKLLYGTEISSVTFFFLCYSVILLFCHPVKLIEYPLSHQLLISSDLSDE